MGQYKQKAAPKERENLAPLRPLVSDRPIVTRIGQRADFWSKALRTPQSLLNLHRGDQPGRISLVHSNEAHDLKGDRVAGLVTAHRAKGDQCTIVTGRSTGQCLGGGSIAGEFLLNDYRRMITIDPTNRSEFCDRDYR